MASKQADMINAIMGEEFFSLGTIQIQYWKTEIVNGAPEQILEQVFEKQVNFSIQGADAAKVQKQGFSDWADNQFFILYMREELPIYNAQGRWFKIVVDGKEYVLRRVQPWLAYNKYWISLEAKSLNAY